MANTAKAEAIRKAYGEYWEKMSPELQAIALRSDGWIKMRDCIKELGEEFSVYSDDLETASTQYAVFKQRPKALQGIETNNGWVRIESEENLPKESGEYWVYESNGDIGIRFYLSVPQGWGEYEMEVKKPQVSHWQPIVKPEKPIY